MKQIGQVGTTRTFAFGDMSRAFEVSDQKIDGAIKPLITSQRRHHD